MRIIPAIYLSDGNAVSHYKGQSEHATILSRNPLQSALQFEKQGATAIHLIDLDGEANGSKLNRDIAKLIGKKTKLLVQFAGGVTTLDEIADLLDNGVDFAGLDQFSEDLLLKANERFGAAKIFFTIRAERMMVEGKKGTPVMDYGKDLAEKGLTHLIFRDIKAEGTLHPNFDEIERLVLNTPAKIFAFGGIGSMKDLEIFERTGAFGAILSRALFEHKLDLGECIARFEK